MKRLTTHEIIAEQVHDIPIFEMQDCARVEEIIKRLAAIEDILGDEYELERLKLLLDNDKSCYTCRNYKGEKKCGFKGLDVEINPQEGCSVREAALRREQDE